MPITTTESYDRLLFPVSKRIIANGLCEIITKEWAASKE
jgi:hypothetical protein